jgi:hypothetical protein
MTVPTFVLVVDTCSPLPHDASSSSSLNVVVGVWFLPYFYYYNNEIRIDSKRCYRKSRVDPVLDRWWRFPATLFFLEARQCSRNFYSYFFDFVVVVLVTPTNANITTWEGRHANRIREIRIPVPEKCATIGSCQCVPTRFHCTAVFAKMAFFLLLLLLLLFVVVAILYFEG